MPAFPRRDQLVRFDLQPAPAAEPPAAPAAGATVADLAGLVVPYGVEVVRFGIRTVFLDATTRLPDDLSAVKLLIQHDDERPSGFATAATRSEDGLRMVFAVDTSHPRAAELVREVELGWRDGFSVGIDLDAECWDALSDAIWDGQEAGADPIPLSGVIREVSSVSIPQFAAARVGASVRPLAVFAHQEGSAMPATLEAAPAVEAAPTLEAAGAAPLTMAELAAALGPFLVEQSAGAAHPLAVFADAGEFLVAAREGRLSDEQRAAFVLADQITANNPGVMPPTWLTTIVGILDRGRPTVSAFGGPGSAGDSGLSIHWPYYDGGFDDLVAVQANEKTEVHSRRVDIKDASANLETYAGASDVSYQLIRRSAPKYRDAYSRILTIGYGVTTDLAFATALVAAGVPADGGTWSIGGDLEALLAALFAASSQVEDAVGMPADVALASPDVFAAIGTLAGLVPGQYGTQNVGGTSSAATLTVSVSGMTIKKDRSLPADTLLVSEQSAAEWAEDGPFPVEADDVPKLGLDVGVWGMGTAIVTVPAGVVRVGAPAAPPLGRSSSSKSS